MNLDLTGSTMDLSGLAAAADKLKKIKKNDNNAVLEINVDLIDPDPEQPRKNFNEDDILELAVDISRNSLIQPIVIRTNPKDENRYYLVAGERRLRAVKLNDQKTIKAIMSNKDWSEKDLGYVQVSENLKRVDLKFYELADFIIKRCNEGEKQKEIADKLGIKDSEVNRYMCWETAPEEIKASKDKFSSIRTFSDFLKVYNDYPEAAKELLDTTEGTISRSAVMAIKKKAIAAAEETQNEIESSSDEFIKDFENQNKQENLSGENEAALQENSIFDAIDTSDSIDENSLFEASENNVENNQEQTFESLTENSSEDEYSDITDTSYENNNENTTEKLTESFLESSSKDDTQNFKRPLILAFFDNMKCEVLYKKKPSSAGLICIKYEDGTEDEVLAENIRLNSIIEA